MTPYLIINHWLIDHASGSLVHQKTGEQRRLGEYQLKLLQVLSEHAGETLTREELTTLVWERRVIGNNSLPNAIHALRLALEDNGKQQRIIKTVPKKGYILEAEYCQFVTPTAPQQDADPASEEPPEQGASDGLPAVVPVAAAETVPAGPLPRRRGRFWPWLILGQSLLFLFLLLVIARSYFSTPPLRAVEKNSVAYSNIRLMEIHRSGEVYSAADDLNKQLGPVLFALNQYLKNRQVTMEIFFYTSGTSLNYTMMFKNRCDHRQLAMNIINWRTDGRQLSALIYREGERKINEMANCVTEPAGSNAVAPAGGGAHEAAAVRQ